MLTDRTNKIIRRKPSERMSSGDEMDIDFAKLRLLKDAAEEACKSAIKRRKNIDDAVNWGDLHCHEAKWTVNEEGQSWYSVVIEEASPTADKLRAAISTFLEAKDFNGVVVETEW